MEQQINVLKYILQMIENNESLFEEFRNYLESAIGAEYLFINAEEDYILITDYFEDGEIFLTYSYGLNIINEFKDKKMLGTQYSGIITQAIKEFIIDKNYLSFME